MAVVDIVAESEDWDSHEGLEARIGQALTVALELAGVQTLDQGEIAVLLTDDEGIAALNGRWRGKPQPTNVLSWPATSPRLLALSPMIGDIAIAYETTAREAQAQGKVFDDHVIHLAVHGALHLLGFDHEENVAAERMEGLERAVLSRLGIADPYATAPWIEEEPPRVER